MKALFTVVFLFTVNSILCSQNILVGEWEIDKIIGIDTINSKDYVLRKADSFRFGNTIKFDFTQSFDCNYHAPCGNDCFRSTKGTYVILNDKFVSFYIIKFKQFTMGHPNCEKKDIDLKLNLGTYLISQKSDGVIKLIKQ